MEAILHFNLPEDAADHKLAVNAMDIAMAITEFDAELRHRWKYGEENIELYGELRSLLRKHFEDNGLVFDEILS